MSLLLPAELILEICTYALFTDEFASLLLVNDQFASCINVHSDYLLSQLIYHHDLSPTLISLYRDAPRPHSISNKALSSKTLLLLEIQQDVQIASKYSRQLTRSYRAVLHFSYVNLPRPIPGSIEALMMMSCLSRLVNDASNTGNQDKTGEQPAFLAINTLAGLDTKSIPSTFSETVDKVLSRQDIESLLRTLDLCADSLVNLNIKPMLTQCSGAEGSIEHWQNDSLRRGVLVECLCWNGLQWYHDCVKTAQSAAANGTSKGDTQPLPQIWTGTHGDAARLGANGVARMLRNERMKRYTASKDITAISGEVLASQTINPLYGTLHMSSGDM